MQAQPERALPPKKHPAKSHRMARSREIRTTACIRGPQPSGPVIVSTLATPGRRGVGALMTDEDKVFAKCAWRLIPLMGLLYAVNLLDRINVGFAALTMNQDLGFSPTVFGFGAGIFSIGFLVFQVPST